MIGLEAPHTRLGFRIAIICAEPVEAESVRAVFDKCWDDEGRVYGKAVGDKNTYITGVIGRHNVVLVLLPSVGSVPAAQGAASLGASYTKIELALVVGICSVAPKHIDTGEEIILGDVVMSTAAIQYDFGRKYADSFLYKTSIQDSLRKAPKEVQGFMRKMQIRQTRQRLTADLRKLVGSADFMRAEPKAIYPGVAHDRLYDATYLHQHRPPLRCSACYADSDAICSLQCNELGCEEGMSLARGRFQHSQGLPENNHPDGGPLIHLGPIGSANSALKTGVYRNILIAKDKLIAFEMVGAGVWDEHPTIIIKGACDYADSHRNQVWQSYAAMMAAGCLKVVLAKWAISDELMDNGMPRSLGLCFASAPLIQRNEFIGRARELTSIHDILWPDDTTCEQRRVVLWGIGGIGKTQLAIGYARQYAQNYRSVLWLDATSEATLWTSFRSVAQMLDTTSSLPQLENLQILAYVQSWLAHASNTCWLLIFDNYNDPDEFSLDGFCPNIGHGSIMITTRLSDRIVGVQLPVRPMTVTTDSLEILRTRSGRENIGNDAGALCLVTRMGGFPLALATAGAYLRKNSLSFQEYFEMYELHWRVDRYQPTQLKEYKDRTLYTTWTTTYNRLEMDCPEAAQMLKLLAYFDNQEIWHGLFLAGFPDNSSSNFRALLANKVDFISLMNVLVSYGVLDVQHVSQSYSMHNCVHDWVLGALNLEVDSGSYWYAFDCIAALIDRDDWHELGELRFARTSRHAVRLAHHRFEQLNRFDTSSLGRFYGARRIIKLLTEQMQFSSADRMLTRVLARCVEILGSEHVLTSHLTHDLGYLYTRQGKLVEAKELFKRAVASYERIIGLEQEEALISLHDLGIVYKEQGKLSEAEQILKRVLVGCGRTLGPDNRLTLITLDSLGVLCALQGKTTEAEQLQEQAHNGYEKLFGIQHTSIINTIHNLGLVYARQGEFLKAKRMYEQALTRKEKAFDYGHISTLETVYSLAQLLLILGELDQAEQMHERALAGYERLLGSQHTSIIVTTQSLGYVYLAQDELDKAEQTFKRGLRRMEDKFGQDHVNTLEAVKALGQVYIGQGKLDEAEQLIKRALTGFERVLGPEHASTAKAVGNLGNIYLKQNKTIEAERALIRALAGFKKAFGLKYSMMWEVLRNLGRLYMQQGKTEEAEGMFLQAVAGLDQSFGTAHQLTCGALNDLGVLYMQQIRLEEAEKMFRQALAGYESCRGSEDYKTQVVLANLKRVLDTQGRPNTTAPQPSAPTTLVTSQIPTMSEDPMTGLIDTEPVQTID